MLPLYLKDPLFSCYVENPLVRENAFRTMTADFAPLPTFAASRHLLPRPMWQGHQPAIECYWRAWELAFGNLRQPNGDSGFVAPYIDMAFNGHLFLWDSVFSLMFGRYGARAFDFQRTLDDLYCKQHIDGFICREIDAADGQDAFHRHDPSSTGPNVLAWSEWEHYRNFADRARLARVFPVLLAYHQWLGDQTGRRRQAAVYFFDARRHPLPRLHGVLRQQGRAPHDDAEPGGGTGAAQDQRQQHRTGRDRHAD